MLICSAHSRGSYPLPQPLKTRLPKLLKRLVPKSLPYTLSSPVSHPLPLLLRHLENPLQLSCELARSKRMEARLQGVGRCERGGVR